MTHARSLKGIWKSPVELEKTPDNHSKPTFYQPTFYQPKIDRNYKDYAEANFLQTELIVYVPWNDKT